MAKTKWGGVNEDRVLDEDRKLGLDFHAPRAMVRFEQLPSDKRREAIKMAKFSEGEEMRTKLLQYLDRIEGIKTPEHRELLNRIIAQYDSSVATWNYYKIDTKGIPSKQDVINWLDALSGDTLKNLSQYGDIRLKFIPPVKVPQLLQAINTYKVFPNQIDSEIQSADDAYGGMSGHEYWENVGGEKWGFGLTVDVVNNDAVHDPGILNIDPRRRRNAEESVSLFEQKFQKQGLEIMPQEAYIPSAMDSLARGIEFNGINAFRRPLEGTTYGVPFAEFGKFNSNHKYDGDCKINLNTKKISGSWYYCRPWLAGK